MNKLILAILGGIAAVSGCSAAPDPASTASASPLSEVAHGKGGGTDRCRHGHDGKHGGRDRCRHDHDAGGGEPSSVAITPDATGWVDATSNPLGIEGPWYPYADGYDDGQRGGTCQTAGHADSECSVIFSPDPTMPGFPNVGGRMCFSGVGMPVLSVNGVPDWANMWGAGMGVDLNNPNGTATSKGVFDAAAHHVIGISFDIDNVPPLGLRAEFGTTGTAGTGIQPYWGAADFYPNSPIVPGTNTVMFSEVRTPEAVPQPLDTARIESIQFLVPTYQLTTSPFNFCISNLQMLIGP